MKGLLAARPFIFRKKKYMTYNIPATNYDFLKGLSQDCLDMANIINRSDLLVIKKYGETCIEAIPGEPIPVGDLNVLVTKEKKLFKDIKVPFELKEEKTHIIKTNHAKILQALFMLLAELLDKNHNNYIMRFRPSVFNYIMSAQFYFLSCLEDATNDFEIEIKKTFFKHLHKIINNELQMYNNINEIIPNKKFMN